MAETSWGREDPGKKIIAIFKYWKGLKILGIVRAGDEF